MNTIYIAVSLNLLCIYAAIFVKVYSDVFVVVKFLTYTGSSDYCLAMHAREVH
jgi:hypothetical protein